MVHNNRTTTFTVSEAFKEDQQGEGIRGGPPPPLPPRLNKNKNKG